MSTTIFDPDGATSVVALVDDPTLPSELDTAQGIERGGASAVFAASGGRIFALGSSEDPTLVRYEVGVDGTFVETGAMSLAGVGLSSAFKRSGLVPFISETKAYWLDDTTGQVVVWNPAEMTITGTFSLEGAADGAWPIWELGERAVLRGDELFVGLRYRSDDDGEAGIAGAVVIDTHADEVVTVMKDDRCGDTVHIIESNGSLYFGSGAIAAVLYQLGRPADYPAPCVLRVLPGERQFDQDFHIALPALVEGRSAGRLAAAGDGRAYLLALHEEELPEPITADTELWAPWEATAWRWWQIDLASGSAGTLVEDAPLASAAGWLLNDGERDYIPHLDVEAGQTTLLVSTQDGLSAGLQVPGLPYGIVKLSQ